MLVVLVFVSYEGRLTGSGFWDVILVEPEPVSSWSGRIDFLFENFLDRIKQRKATAPRTTTPPTTPPATAATGVEDVVGLATSCEQVDPVKLLAHEQMKGVLSEGAQTPAFKHGLGMQTLVVQLTPLNPLVHEHLYPVIEFRLHTPLFLHGLGLQESSIHVGPLKPAAQEQVKPFEAELSSTHTAPFRHGLESQTLPSQLVPKKLFPQAHT